MRRISVIGLAVAAVLVAVLALGVGRSDVARANPDVVNAGYDLLETGDPTFIDFNFVPIPPDFFGPGSDPFTDFVGLEGVPIPDYDPGTGPVGGLWPASTIVKRPQPAGGAGFPDTVPIEIVELSLKSVSPITVTYNGGQNPEQWDLDVVVPENDPNQVQGQITMRHDTPGGGTFDVQLPVKPILTFTKLGPPNEGMQLSLNWHLEALPPLEFQAANENWCHTANPLASPPDHVVLDIPSLTSNFFPGITCTPDQNVRNKALFTLDAGAAVHSVQPAEVQEPHYKCYQITDVPPTVAPVDIETQFGLELGVQVGPASLLCPPALKNGEGNLGAPHLKCYDIVGQDPQQVVRLEDQFGVEESVVVGQATRLCVPAVKTPIFPPEPPSGPLLPAPHYECFQIDDPAPSVPPVTLETQFGIEPSVAVGVASFLCAPALKNGGGDLNVPHLKCYDIVDTPPGYTVDLEDQFGVELGIEVGPAQMLCVPADKTVLGPVGGIAEFPDVDGSPLSASDPSSGSSLPYAAVAAGLAAVVAVMVGGWYARRRLSR